MQCPVVACQFPNPEDATSFYRGVGPLALLERQEKIRMMAPQQFTWSVLKCADILFTQRPYTSAHVKLIQMAKAFHKPVWVDYDDDLFSVPTCNPTFKIYGSEHVQLDVIACLREADIVTVSTTALYDKFRRILRDICAEDRKSVNGDEGKVILLPNAYDEEVLGSLDDAPGEQHSMVMWRGSQTHDGDLDVFTDPLVSAVSRHLNWTYVFIGSLFWRTRRKLEEIQNLKKDSVIAHPTLDIIDYYQTLRRMKPAVMIVPLEDIPFNRAKSNIAWIEATHAGAVVLAPEWEEWKRPGVIHYANPYDFGKKLDHILSGQYETAKRVALARESIKRNLTLENTNRTRASIVQQLMSMTRSQRVNAV